MPQPRAIVPDNGGVRAGYNGTGSTIAKYRIVKRATTAVDGVTPGTDGSDVLHGVTMQAISDGYAGDVQVAGRALVEAGVAITIGAKITAGAGGKAAIASSGNQIIGVANSTAAVDGDVIEVDITRGTAP
jgi:hypothetical protein